MSSGTEPIIAVVDDNEANRYAIVRILTVAGFTVRQGSSIADGVRLAGESPDMLILDVRLPDGNGFDLSRRLRSDVVTRDLPLLLISASFIDSEWKIEALRGGADGYLTHPIEPPELIATVRSLLRARDAERKLRLAAREWTATFDALADAICVTNRAGAILRCNRAFADLFERSFPEILGQPLGSLVAGLTGDTPQELRIGPRWYRVTSHISRGNIVEAPLAWVLTDITERKRTMRRQAVELAVAQVLTSATPREQVMQDILRAMGGELGWRWGAVWMVDRDRQLIRCSETWTDDPTEPAEFASVTRAHALALGKGLPGRVWKSGHLAWIPDVLDDTNFPRLEAARIAGFHGALAFPVVANGEIVAVIEFLSGNIEQPDPELVAVVATVGSQLGQFIERIRADDRVGQLLMEERRARTAAEAAAARDAFLAEAGNLLASSLDYEKTLVEVAELSVKQFAAWCAIDILDDDGGIRRLAMANTDPAKNARSWELYEQYPGRLDSAVGIQEVSRTRRPTLLDELSTDAVRQRWIGPVPLDGLHALGVTSYLAVPLLMRDRVLGAVSFAMTDAQRRFAEVDVTVGVRLALKIALAIDNARLFRDVQAAVRRKDETLVFLDSVLRTAPVGLAFLDRDLRAVRINNALAEMAGRSAGDDLGRPLEELLPPEWRLLADHFQTVFAAGEPLTEFEWSGEQPGRPGRTQHILASYYPIRDLHGMVNWVGMVVSDVTERKRAEEAIRQTQKLESIGLLAGGIAHDFNNLLTGILGNASLARRALPPASAAAPMLSDVIRASERAAALTSQLLAYAGKGRFYVEPIDLGKLVHDITGLIHTSLPKKVEIRIHLDPHLPMLEADAGQLQQVLMNLVINGAEAIGDTPGAVTVTAEAIELGEDALDQRFSVFSLAPGRYVRLEVRDTGSGMDAATQARIFDPFFTTKFTGRGLGLAAVLGIIRGHKGGITVDSEIDRGTIFTVVLPALADAPVAATPAAERSARQGAGIILIADDEEIVRRITRTALEESGYSVVEAVNGIEAVDLARRYGDKIVLALLDMTMPVMGGDEAVRHLKRLRPDLPVLVMSGYGELEAIRRFTGTGVNGFLQKPYTAEQLLDRLESVLSKR